MYASATACQDYYDKRNSVNIANITKQENAALNWQKLAQSLSAAVAKFKLWASRSFCHYFKLCN